MTAAAPAAPPTKKYRRNLPGPGSFLQQRDAVIAIFSRRLRKGRASRSVTDNLQPSFPLNLTTNFVETVLSAKLAGWIWYW